MSWRFRYVYSVSAGEVERFVGANACVGGFLAKYQGESRLIKARILCMFFKWLRLVKKQELGPGEFLQLLSEKRNSVDPAVRLWGRGLLLEFSRDNKDLKGKSVSYRYGMLFTTVKLWCDYNEVPITSAKAVFGEKIRRKYSEPPFTVDKAKKVLAIENQRNRAVCMTSLQSGQSLTQVLCDINAQGKYIIHEIHAGKQRIRVDFRERKGNNFPYHSFISADGIQEIKKWLPTRQRILDKHAITESPWLFIKEDGTQLTPDAFKTPFRQKLQRHGLWTGPYSARFHGFRKLFETEASPPERGISKAYVKFMMGHATDEMNGDRLDVPGGVYDDVARVHPDVVEKEYAKLEPYINIYSGKAQMEGLGISEEDLESLKELLEMMRQGKVKIDS